MKAESSSAVGIWLRRARDKLRVSRQALATAAGISPSTLRNAETSRHRISRHTAALLIQEIAKRDAILAHTAPSPLKESAPPQAKRTDSASKPGSSEQAPLAHLRFQPSGPRALLQVELDQRAVRKLVRALRDLLARSQQSPRADLPGLHLVLVEEK